VRLESVLAPRGSSTAGISTLHPPAPYLHPEPFPVGPVEVGNVD